jgi:E3 ubiquitin-protein ligase HUWE1
MKSSLTDFAALFEPCAADQQTYQPNKASSVNGDHLSYFKFVGRVIGKAVFEYVTGLSWD